jgi:uncharacterized protein Yka (UPF0111/DUF47 family)
MAALLPKASAELVGLFENFTDVKTKALRIKDLEHEGDTLSHQIYEQLNRTFITPLEPEEISRLASSLDNVLDYIDGTARKLRYYGISESDQHMIELAKLIQLSVVELEEGVKGIRTMKNPDEIEKRCIEINRLENIADDVKAQAILDLFTRSDAVAIIKLKDIYESLEKATDMCEDAANVLSDIAIRHS